MSMGLCPTRASRAREPRYYYAAFLAPSCLISQPQWLIDMRKCPTISPDEALHDRADLKANVCTVLCIIGAFWDMYNKARLEYPVFYGSKI